MSRRRVRPNREKAILGVIISFLVLVGLTLTSIYASDFAQRQEQADQASRQASRQDNQSYQVSVPVLDQRPAGGKADQESSDVNTPENPLASDQSQVDDKPSPAPTSPVDYQDLSQVLALPASQVYEYRQQFHRQPPANVAGQAYVTVNNNTPLFSSEDFHITASGWERYSNLDQLGRVGTAEALLDQQLMPADDQGRDSLVAVTPSGWDQAYYPGLVSGGWLYNRSHLIGYQLTGQQDNMLNLMAGTRYFNVEGMLPFENYVAAYIEESNAQVRYRVSPVFVGQELLARGIYLEGLSLDADHSLQFHIYIPNHQPGVYIDYQTGASRPQNF
ncbi:hypothetical protein AWM75_03280 [Aerococcus urinaehominis]|uniref:Type VII secretion system protein EssD-like domain-containing protein n=1 Tax=Aerococcus urinaehominis TaxID=128944 RepID=A0A0X8FLZ0_9LACT|nr:DNA/RNA non-specific endonuclease [Aerococcus urinaehominis]AMB99082.1 hypothetical protein AWM75_03280 [Aerococcus urinaehominis]SDM02959.1 DNA/RNA non-specific endonuclease [Aerococcus urinaehominis]